MFTKDFSKYLHRDAPTTYKCAEFIYAVTSLTALLGQYLTPSILLPSADLHEPNLVTKSSGKIFRQSVSHVYLI